MKLNPEQAPLYGRCVITVQLADEELALDDEGVDYFLLFAGSTQRHLTSTLMSSHDTLQAMCPAHDCCEVVLVTLCSISRGPPEDPNPCPGPVTLLGEHRFRFVQDLAFDMAQFLVSTAGRADGLDGALLLDECQIPLQECERLDESLALALHHLALPPGWSLLGNKLTNSTDLDPQETLLHFSARRGLYRVTHFLLKQPGAREALRLANRQGHTPSAVADLRGHERLVELLAQAETDKDTETFQPVCTDARVVCHLPRLNTHTLTLRIHPVLDPPTLQRSVEQLLHLLNHVHAKGVSVLELHFDSLHTADECCDGVEEITCQERLQLSESPDTTTGGIWVENCSSESSGRVDCGHGETENAEREWSLSLSDPTPDTRPREHGLSPRLDWVCLSSNTARDYCQAEQEGRGQPVVPTQSLRSEGAGGESLTVGIFLPPPAAEGSDKQAEETDRGEAVIWEGQEAKEGSEQEAEESTVRKREEDTESTDPIPPCGDVKASVMGQSPSSEGSDASDSEMKECCQELSLEEEKEEGLAELVSDRGDLPSPPMIDGADVIEEPQSALSIEGLHEGEPPPHTNSLEQNQETAGRDYASEQQQQQASHTGPHSGSAASDGEPDEEAEASGCSAESLSLDEPEDTADCVAPANSMEDLRADPSPDLIPRDTHTGQDSEMSHVISSDDDGSFRSVGSSTTDIFLPSQENASVADQGLVQTNVEDVPSAGLQMEEPDDSREVEANRPIVVQLDTVSLAEPERLPNLETLEGLNLDERVEELAAELPKEDLLLSERGDAPTAVDDTEPEGATESEVNAEMECFASEDISSVSFEASASPTDESEPISSVEHQSNNTSDESAAERSGDVQQGQPKQDNSEMTADERSPEEGLRHSEDRINASLSVGVTPLSSEASSGPDAEEETAGNPLDTVDGEPQSPSGAVQEGEVMVSEGAAGEGDDDVAPEETHGSTIHRDREASFHQPCNAPHSGSSQSSEFPSLPSRTSSCPSSAHRDSGSDIESFLGAEPGYDSVFRKSDDPVTGADSASEVSVSCSSTDDTASSSLEGSQGLECSWSPEESIRTGAAVSAGGGGEAEEEAKDRVTEVPRRSCILRNSIRSLSPLRRHSWGPGKNNGGDAEMNHRSYSLEGLSEELRGPITGQGPRVLERSRMPRLDIDHRGSLVSLIEVEEEHSRLRDPLQMSRRYRPLRNSCPTMTLPLTKSVSMLAISQRDIDGMRSFSSASGSLAYSISEEEPGPLRSDADEKSTTKVSRTFSYLKNKMYKKTREKEKREKDKDGKEKDKKAINGHLFSPVSPGRGQCVQCSKAFNSKEAYLCTHCNASVHKSCRDSLPVCAKVKMKLPKQQYAVPDSVPFPTVTMRNKSGGTRERPWSAILSPEDHSSSSLGLSSRRNTSIMGFHGNNLSKSLSISNIAGPVFDDIPIRGLRYLSQSTDSLNRTNQVTESMESLTDEGTEMMDGQLMGEFEAEAREMEADSWSLFAEQQYLKQLDKELVKKQDVIYELMQTELHHIRTLRILSEVYSKGLQKELQLELQTVEKLFPVLDELLELHTQHLLRLLERKRESQLQAGSSEGGFIIRRIGDILLGQFSGCNGENMKRIYGRFCSRHNEAVNLYKDLLTKDKRFKAFIKKKMSSSIVRRLGIPECILLVTQRITKYPVLIQRMLQHTRESEEDHKDLAAAVRLVKEVIAAVDSKVNEHEKRRRLKDFHGRMDSKSIMMMKSGQMFAREDLLRRRLIHDGGLQLKNIQGRLKDVHALLLSDILVFLQEKDQKYVFSMLDQRSTVISLQNLIVREVANEERGLFLITAGIEKPEMMEVLASSKEERNTWMQLIQEAMQSMEKDEDEGIPSETEDDKRQQETKAKEMRALLRQKDTEILSLLEEKVQLFRGMWEGPGPGEEAGRPEQPLFRSACSLETPRGAAIMKDALQEVETLQGLVNGSLGGAMASVQEGGGAVCLPRRAETFGGFDSHQMHSSKSADGDDSEDSAGDLRRTESDSVLKKGGNANLLLLLKKNSEVLHSVSNLHLLLSTLQAVVVQQDSFIEDQRAALSERSSSCTSLSRPSSRPSSLIEQEKTRSLEKQRQELASLQRQQAAHNEERRKREREWETREEQLVEREGLLHGQEEEVLQQEKDLQEERQGLQSRKEEYQRDLERLRDAQRKLERDREAVQRQIEKMEEVCLSEMFLTAPPLLQRTPSTALDDSQFPGGSQPLEPDPQEPLQPPRSKPKGKGLNPFSSSSGSLKGNEANRQISKSLLQLAKNKSREGKEKDKKKKKGKGGGPQTADPLHLPEPPLDGEIFFC
ncbi:A-kinase anchor protein 13 isoform X2 [Eleginops maclovinus]|uniref:A-kinase anchor protein 13 isoform X2 n=1 Tax=Eleginops maclovinus TaxID=56733 RepID=UPI0030809524